MEVGECFTIPHLPYISKVLWTLQTLGGPPFLVPTIPATSLYSQGRVIRSRPYTAKLGEGNLGLGAWELGF